ncbi:hypothetical protein [Croceitalea vernalis]|uniref:Class IIb bacteriocin, lactobin A/cerein 7B family n=1 Tax=Croceitalea vernalis TaxID=3075599 RepID=A0ABU3BGZ9_9FLAO|nr:hypothetical protein [Croceitalea sp. P007]MDT0621432.1 hypothetical protein [Croceitalea sp. P007]
MKNVKLVELKLDEKLNTAGGVDPVTAIGVVFGLAATFIKGGYDLGGELYRATHK